MDTLLVVAIVPAAMLLWYVYKLDPVEKEPGRLLARLLGYGALACFPAVALEMLGTDVLLGGGEAYSLPMIALENFVIVALSEEVCKFVFLRWKTWNHPAFDYVFDGIVYAVFVSLGFAILENIGYVYEYGMATGVVRAFTAIPGHAIFGVFMGCFYGLAKRAQMAGNQGQRAAFMAAALIVPIFCHGFYDFCASIDNEWADMVFFGFLFVLMLISMRLVKHMSLRAHPVHHSVFSQDPAQPLQSSQDPYQGQPMPYVQQGQPDQFVQQGQLGQIFQQNRSANLAQPAKPGQEGPFSKP